MKHLIIKTFTALFRDGKFFWQCMKCGEQTKCDTTPAPGGCPRTPGYHKWAKVA